jgi:ribonucleoside-diphosphate reductase alpha chain
MQNIFQPLNPCLTESAWIHTTNGPQQVKNLIGQEFSAIVNGKVYKSNYQGFFNTGIKQTYKVKTKNGFELILTDNHPLKKVINLTRYDVKTTWTDVKDLQKGDKIVISNHRKLNSWSNNEEYMHLNKGTYDQGWLVGNLLGDGYFNNEMAILNYWGKTKYELREIAVDKIQNNFQTSNAFGKYSDSTVLELERDEVAVSNQELGKFASTLITKDKNILPATESMSSLFTSGFLSGWFDADGSVQGNTEKGISIRLSSSNLHNLKIAQRMLLRLGVVSTIYENRRTEGEKLMPDGKGGKKLYKYVSQHELVISNDNIKVFVDTIGFSDSLKSKKLINLLDSYNRTLNRERFVDEIESITFESIESVYDCTIPEVHEFDANGLNVHNCGEQVLPVGAVCLLGSINLTQFVDFKNKTWDFKKLDEVIPIAIRFMDNVNDITHVPLESQKENLRDKRRIGLGIMGYGSALMMLKMRYGSKEALKITEELMDFMMNAAYQASANIAGEKGSFLIYDEKKYLAGNFVKNLKKETIELIKKNGLRNSHLLSIQPTGNSSIFANVVSGGLEPIFMPVYVRTTMMPYPPNGLDIPKNVDWANKKYESLTNWEWIKEGDDNLLRVNFEGYNWKFDRDRGLLRETVVKDYAVRFLEEKNEWNINADWAATTTQLSIDEHVQTMAVMSKCIDSAMSKTVNIPNDYDYEDFKRLYMEFYKTKTIKGGTTYRAGTMTEVLGAVDKQNTEGEDRIIKTTAPKRPKTLPCDIYNVTVNGEHYIVIVGLHYGDPYEVFAFKQKAIKLPARAKAGSLTRIKKGQYDLQVDDWSIENIGELFETDEQESVTRLISTNLRHGTDIKFIVEQLNKSAGTIVSFNKSIARTLKRYISDDADSSELCPSCGEKSLVYQEGCLVCINCSASKC